MRRRIHRIPASTALALGLLLAAAGIAPAEDATQDSTQDVFDASAFDQGVQQGTQQEEKSALETQFGGNLLYDTSVTTTADLAGYGAGGSFSGKAFVKVSVPSYGALFLSYNFSKNLYQGAAGTVPGAGLSPGGPVLAQPAGDLYGVTFTLSEFFASFDLAQAVFFRVGNQLLAWGPSLVWTPVDFVNLQRVNPLSPLDLRVGKPGIRVSVPMGIANLFLFADMSGTVSATGPGGALVVNDLFQATNVAARLDMTLAGYELALTGFSGLGVQSQAGFDFSGRLLGFDVYGEIAAAVPTGASPFTWAASLGLQRTFGELKYWSLAGELFYNDAGSSDISGYPALAAAGAFTPFYVGKLYSYASLTRTHLFVDGVSTTLAGFMDASDLSFLARLSASIDLPKAPAFALSLGWAGGGENKAFTYVTGNNSLTAELRMSVEF